MQKASKTTGKTIRKTVASMGTSTTTGNTLILRERD